MDSLYATGSASVFELDGSKKSMFHICVVAAYGNHVEENLNALICYTPSY